MAPDLRLDLVHMDDVAYPVTFSLEDIEANLRLSPFERLQKAMIQCDLLMAFRVAAVKRYGIRKRLPCKNLPLPSGSDLDDFSNPWEWDPLGSGYSRPD